jgi:hypothetical protein
MTDPAFDTNYTIENYRDGAYAGYTKLFDSTNPSIDPVILNSSIGFTGSGKIEKDVFIDGIDRVRILRFCSFWSQSNQSIFQSLGGKIAQVAGIATNNNTGENISSANYFVTYILIFMLRLNSSFDPGFGQLNPPVSFFAGENNPSFSPVVNSGKTFIQACLGLGNIPYNTSSPRAIEIDYINKGFVYTYCKEVEENFCKDKELEGEECTVNYRDELGNNPILTKWCGCFAPLTSLIQEQFNNAGLNKNPNRCDYFCFQTNTYDLFNRPGTGFGNALNCDDSTICVLDKNNININGNNQNLRINFEQVCKCPANRICLCFLDVDYPGLLDNVSDGDKALLNQAVYLQRCNNTTCYTVEGEKICNPINTPESGRIREYESLYGRSIYQNYKEISQIFWVGLILIALFILLYIITFLEISYFVKDK